MGQIRSSTPLNSTPEARISESAEITAIRSSRQLQNLWSWASRPSTPPCPPVSSISRTSPSRLSEPDVSPTPFPSEPIPAKAFQRDAALKPKTVLYLAYGSNMCAQTFLGMRGIRPLSQINVSAPSLDLTFDLPGIPYREPCFANTAPRKIPGKPPLEPPKLPPNIPDHPPIKPPATQGEEDDDRFEQVAGRRPVWNKGLYGVVYEVTPEDYAKIIATEGGGASYLDILVPCFPLPPNITVLEKPPVPIPPAPFLAHTLCAPRLPDVPDGGDDEHRKRTSDDNGDEDGAGEPRTADADPKPRTKPKPALPPWARKFLRPVRRPSPDYAQPSARYLKLLRDGAREHELPADYRAYLEALQSYTITTTRQKLGQVLFLGFWAPLVIMVMYGGRLVADDRGRLPPWLAALSAVIFNSMWLSYDCVGKRLFGDGERTMVDEKRWGHGKGRRGSFADGWRGKVEAVDEEEACLLDDS
ncbi:hypothetical protein VTK56DRAFT_1717 [Thermocarpiscus australiensis]